MKHKIIVLLLSVFTISPSILFCKTVDIALVRDGPTDSFLPLDQVKRELDILLRDEFTIQYVEQSRADANWTLESVKNVIRRLYADKTTDLVITIGPIASNEVSKIKPSNKPTIATFVINPLAQGLPINGNKSGRNNFTYIADKNAGGEIEFFTNFTGLKRFAVLVEPFLASSWKELEQLLTDAENELDISIKLIPIGEDLNETKNRIPSNTEAVMVGLLSQHSESEKKELANLLIDLNLPSYTFLGEKGVDLGFMVTDGQLEQDRSQIARRIALDAQRILLGMNAKDLPIHMRFNSRVVYNESTALKTGFSPEWKKIINAKVLHRDGIENRRAFTITQAIAYAIQNNLSLQANSISVDIAQKDVGLARSNLYPTLSIGANYRQINESQAVVGNPERRADANLILGQSLYSESRWATYDISEHLFESQNEQYKAQILDIAHQAASAYLGLLSAKASERIQASNLELTQKNLELAQNRFRVGTSNKSDVLRFKSQIASNQQSLLRSISTRQSAELDLSRIMNLRTNVLVDVREPDVSSLLSILTDARFQTYVNNRLHWSAFQEFYKIEAISNAPELKSFDAQLNAKKRDILATKRGSYIPDVNLVAQIGRNISQNGGGIIENTSQNSWTIGVEATLPIDLSGSRRANLSRKELQSEQLNLNRLSTQQQIISNTSKALKNIGSSYLNIQLSKDASKAASASLELVQDAYAKGAVSISDLLDAQTNALNSELTAINSEYNFLQDYMILMRSAGDFKPILNGKYSSDWFNRLHKFFKDKRIAVDPS